MDGDDVGVIEAGRKLGFPSQGVQIAGVICNGLVDNLDGNDPIQAGIAGAVNRTLASTAYLLEDFVSADSLQHGWAGL
jgi:hypothetical protein